MHLWDRAGAMSDNGTVSQGPVHSGGLSLSPQSGSGLLPAGVRSCGSLSNGDVGLIAEILLRVTLGNGPSGQSFVKPLS